MAKRSAMFLAVTLSIGALVAPLAARAAEISFQGLTGASTRQDVLKRFPTAAHSRSLCGPQDTEERSADGVASCDELELSSYRVGDTSFDVLFLFSLDGKLWQVILLYTFTDSPNWSQIFSKYMDLRNLLVTKYGEPLSRSPCAEMGDMSSRFFNLCSMWQGSPAKYYEPSEGSIDLNADGTKHDASDSDYRFAHVGITYHLIPAQDAGRL